MLVFLKVLTRIWTPSLNIHCIFFYLRLLAANRTKLMLLLSPNHLSLCFRIPKYIHTYSKRRWCIYQKINISFYLLGPYSAQICLSKFLLYIAESLVHAGNEDLPTTTHWDCQILHSVMRCLFTLAPVFFKKTQISIVSV